MIILVLKDFKGNISMRKDKSTGNYDVLVRLDLLQRDDPEVNPKSFHTVLKYNPTDDKLIFKDDNQKLLGSDFKDYIVDEIHKNLDR